MSDKYKLRDYALLPLGMGSLAKDMFSKTQWSDWIEFFVHVLSISAISQIIAPNDYIAWVWLMMVGIIIFDYAWIFKCWFRTEKAFRDYKDRTHRILFFAIPVLSFVKIMMGDGILGFAAILAWSSHVIIDMVFGRIFQ